MSIHRLFFAGSFLFLCLLLNGCGPAGPPVNAVEGTVTLDGKPFDYVTVSFMSATTSDLGFAGTDAQGHYKLSMLGAKPETGIVVGEYTVIFDKTVPDGPRPTEAELANPDFDPSSKYNMDKTKQLVPKKYLSSSTSGFKVKVEKGKNTFDFELLSK
jgi:hypothetical protein